MIDCIDMALAELKKTDRPDEKICSSSAYWIPLQWLYVRMVENKDLIPLVKLPWAEKQRFWKKVSVLRPDRTEQFFKISLCQALYVFEKGSLYSRD